jgi:hypothetical protein
MTWRDVTTTQDKVIERNAAGLRLFPGPLFDTRRMPSAFVARYLREMATSVTR